MVVSPAVYSGFCASFASMFGKLSGLEFLELDEKLRYPVKIICACLMILLNSLVWTFFVKALQKSKTTIEATAVSSAINYVFSGILGYVVFGEVSGLWWWFGISLIVTGILVMNNSDLESERRKD
ncbi:hypothetical protein RUM44_003092 [Polyplax serrata]|uniref:EamA domain-containing protein n=1 Tax=Polyplax serrata TaxID=468196 RepID=A0ABR1AXK2_POLSC